MPVEVEVDGSVFAFPAGSVVEKIDAWPEHDQVASAFAAKSCDVVALIGSTLWLIEAKDYSYDGARVPKGLPHTVAAKVHGSLALLHAAARWRSGARGDFSRQALSANEAKICLSIDLPIEGSRLLPAQLKMLADLKFELRRSCRRLGEVRPTVSGWNQQSNVPWTVVRSPGTRHLHLPS